MTLYLFARERAASNRRRPNDPGRFS